jgi:maltose/maltodextrin transport system permease protein
VWAWASPRAMALRFLLPGAAAALVFVVFPMLYTVGMAFTNQSSRNLLSESQARAVLLADALQTPGSARNFTLHAQADGRWKVQLSDGLLSQPFGASTAPQRVALAPGAASTPALPLRAVVEALPTLRGVSLVVPAEPALSLASLREFAHHESLYREQGDGELRDGLTGTVYRPDRTRGFFTSAGGEDLQPGFQVGVGWQHFQRLFGEAKFREPFMAVFAWTVVFAALSVAGAAALGLVLACLLHWQALRGKAVYRLVLFLPYAVPGFLSILVFKGLFNQNLGEINLILDALFGLKPAWFSEPTLARAMLLIVNIWLGFPYMMVLCSGLLQSIPADLYEASAIEGAGPLTNFFRITLPLIARPLAPLAIAAFAFNFNNFVLVSLLTNGRPDHTDAVLPAGTTDLLVTYTWRIAFQDAGQQFGLAAAVSTVIFVIVAVLTLAQLRLMKRGSN